MESVCCSSGSLELVYQKKEQTLLEESWFHCMIWVGWDFLAISS